MEKITFQFDLLKKQKEKNADTARKWGQLLMSLRLGKAKSKTKQNLKENES